MKHKTNKHTKRNANRNSDPAPAPSERKDKTHHFKLTFNLKLLVAKQLSVKTVIQDTCKSIYKKTGCKAGYSTTS